ncbi:sensor histidine kinase [Arcicella rigui]|uniref:Histidine kinase n=1 Tax=Arcicella rigui TaxID=797020 RepID=A0ABU5QE29_9BACT|nr:histidine kinase [Arcicella rigui]MEA5141109.1 histidine kinase [Arcicella rigui]
MTQKEIIFHASAIITFVFLPVLIYPHPPEAQNILFASPTIRDFIGNALMMVFFYINYYYFIPKVYLNERYFVYAGILIAFLFLICWFPSFITGRFVPYNFPDGEPFPPIKHHFPVHFAPKPRDGSFLEEIKHHIWVYAIVVLFSILLHTRNRLLKAENEKLQAELSNLKAQIHPHFLFNTLNSIYALAIRKDDKTPETIIRLSEFMRYLLKDVNQNQVSLEKEISYIENYLDLQKSRLRNSVAIEYWRSGNFSAKQIAPLLLFNYIENAFKHGVNPEENSKISIKISLNDQLLSLEVKNNVVTQQKNENSLHIGMPNTQERLDLLYPKKYVLDIQKTEETYTVLLQIQLT